MSYPLVSVCVVTYNQEQFIEECLDSIVGQKVDFDIEVIVSDDASTDATSDIIRSYADKYHFIKPVFRKTNIGAYRNFIETHAMAQGEFICHCDGDDYWLPSKLEKQIKFMTDHPECVFSWHRMEVVFPDGRKKPDTVHDYFKNRPLSQQDVAAFMAIGLHSSKMYRASTWPKHLFDAPIIDYSINIIQLNDGVAFFIGDEILGGYRKGVGIASDGSKTKNIIANVMLFFYRNRKKLRRSISFAALTLLVSSIKNRRYKDVSLFMKICTNRHIFLNIFMHAISFKKIRSLSLPK